MPAKKTVEVEEETVKCRHCGAVPEEEPTKDDWLCKACERYQNFALCPTCGSPVQASALGEYTPKEEVSE